MLTFFETWNKGELPNLYKHDEADFACLKSMGVDVIRLPVHFDLLMEPYDTGTIYDFVLKRLDQVCDWAEKYQIYLIIDDHSFNTEEYDNNPPSVQLYQEHLESVWSQIASRYCDRSQYIIYEILNEPKSQGDIANKWVKLQQEIIDIIRSYDPDRDIVVTSADFSSIDTLVKMKPYKDPNLIYSFHFYEPFVFTHQGATWVGKEMMDLEDVPFPYDWKKIPKLKGNAKNSWIQDYLRDGYNTDGTVSYINNRIKKAADWAKKNKVRVWCGEMGAKTWINSEYRLAWINATRTALLENDIPYCCWGLDGSDGFLESDSKGLTFPDDIDQEALEAYGFAMPDERLAEKSAIDVTSQKPYIVYDGILGKGSDKILWGKTKEKFDNALNDFYFSVSYPSQSSDCRLYLPHRLTSLIAENTHTLSISLSVKFSNYDQNFYLLFRDNDEGEDELPWNTGYLIQASDYSTGEWITVEVPLSEFTNTWGTFSDKTGKYYNLPGQFDWERLECIYFDFDDFDNKYTGEICVDDIVIKKK